MSTSPIAEEIKRLVRESGRSVFEIAGKLEIPYQPLNRFIRGRSPAYDLVNAERIYIELTGKPFVEGASPGA